MAKFYCNKCKEDVELRNGECPKCGTNWQKIIDNSISHERENMDYYEDENKNLNQKESTHVDYNERYVKDIKGVWSFFLDYAKVCKYIFFAFAGIVFIGMFLYESPPFYILLFHLIAAFSFILMGIIFEKTFKWVAYMLKTNYEISKNTKK